MERGHLNLNKMSSEVETCKLAYEGKLEELKTKINENINDATAQDSVRLIVYGSNLEI